MRIMRSCAGKRWENHRILVGFFMRTCMEISWEYHGNVMGIQWVCIMGADTITSDFTVAFSRDEILVYNQQ